MNTSYLQSSYQKLVRSSELLGHTIAWLCIAMALAMFTTVVLRYGFDVGSIALQESITYMHASLFTLAAGHTLQKNEHVRVDIFYRNMTIRQQAYVNLFGTTFLLVPMLLTITYFSWDYIVAAWSLKEGSHEADGLPYVYLLKALILALVVSLGLQGLADIIKCIIVLLDVSHDTNKGER